MLAKKWSSILLLIASAAIAANDCPQYPAPPGKCQPQWPAVDISSEAAQAMRKAIEEKSAILDYNEEARVLMEKAYYLLLPFVEQNRPMLKALMTDACSDFAVLIKANAELSVDAESTLIYVGPIVALEVWATETEARKNHCDPTQVKKRVSEHWVQKISQREKKSNSRCCQCALS